MNKTEYKQKNFIRLLLLLCLICGIILNSIDTFADASASALVFKPVKYAIAGPITGNCYIYNICTDALKYHVKANGYSLKYGDAAENNNFSEFIDNAISNPKMQGYGQYTLKLNGLYGFIEYLIYQNDNNVNSQAIIPDESDPTDPNKMCTIERLKDVSKQTLNTTSKKWMGTFWDRLSAGAFKELFNAYQDSYFFKNYTYKAQDKIKSTLHDSGGLSLKNLSTTPNSQYAAQSSKEYMTLLTTYMYSINREEQLSTVGRGDLVPFLYYAEHTDCRDPKEIAKYAYVALCSEFLRVSGTNYWKNEFKDIFNIDLDYFELTDTERFRDFVDKNQEYDEELKQNDQFTDDIETLEEWYDETYEKYKNDRGAKQNPLLGSDIDTIIASEYSISNQLAATKMYIESIYSELGIDLDINEHIARNELMAKYMMENSHIADTIEDYCVEINFVTDNLQHGTYEEKNGTTAVLSDLQTIDFGEPIKEANSKDRDKDGITNKEELGNIKWIDITSFLEKTFNEKSRKGEISGTFETHIDNIVKDNGYYEDNPNSGHIKKEKDIFGNIKVLYRTYDYKSNPALKDTDFDGIDDKEDGKPLSGTFQGQTDIERSDKLNVDYTNDFRYFFIDNNKYNDELAQMSLIISNLANDTNRKIDLNQGGLQVGRMNVGGSHIGDLDITGYLGKIGFSPLGNLSLFGDEGKAYLYQKVIDYYALRDENNKLISGNEKLVIGIFIGGFESENSYKKLVVDNNNLYSNYDDIINEVVEKINNIKASAGVKPYIDSGDYSFWITGKNIPAAIANGIANKLNCPNNTYCYAFASPNVGINFAGSYVKNIINEDDLLPKINSDDYGIGGNIYNKSIYWDLIPEYREYIENPKKYKGNYKKTNRIKKGLETNGTITNEDIRPTFMQELASYLYKLIGKEKQEVTNSVLSDTQEYFNENCKVDDDLLKMIDYKDEVSSGNSTKAYWCLAKSLNGYDEKHYYDGNVNNYKDVAKEPVIIEEIHTDDEGKIHFDSILGVLTHLAKYYMNTINTHETENQSGRANDLANGENGAIKYKDKPYGKIIEYKYDDLHKLKDIRDDSYKVFNTRIFGPATGDPAKDNRDFNLRPYNTGDSCSDFAITAIRMLSDGYRGEPTDSYDKKAKDKDKDDHGLYLHNTYSLIMQGVEEEGKEKDRPGAVGSLSFERAMNRLGWTKIYVTEDMTVDDLEIGDILVSNKHTEFYTGTNFDTTYVEKRSEDRNELKQSGIDKISMLSSDRKVIENGKLLGTFGWGGVQNEFPLESGTDKLCYFYKYPDEDYFRLCWCGKEPNRNSDNNLHTSANCEFNDMEHQYKFIWRKE